MNMSKDCKLTTAITPTAGAAGTSTIDATSVDMSAFESVLMVARFGAITAGAATSLKALQSSDVGVADAYCDLAGTSQSVAVDDDGEAGLAL